MSNSLFFTVINPDTEEETRVNIESKNGVFDINGLKIDSQQLAELGMLLFALAAPHKPDLDSCAELIDGFNLDIPQKELKEVAGL